MVKKEILKRVNITLSESIYEEIVRKRKWKLSGTIREALEDVLSNDTITLSTSPETKALYHEIFNKSQCTDKDIEPYFRLALKQFIDDVLKKKTHDLQSLRDKL